MFEYRSLSQWGGLIPQKIGQNLVESQFAQSYDHPDVS